MLKGPQNSFLGYTPKTKSEDVCTFPHSNRKRCLEHSLDKQAGGCISHLKASSFSSFRTLFECPHLISTDSHLKICKCIRASREHTLQISKCLKQFELHFGIQFLTQLQTRRLHDHNLLISILK